MRVLYLLIRRKKENYSTSADVNLVLLYYVTLGYIFLAPRSPKVEFQLIKIMHYVVQLSQF